MRVFTDFPERAAAKFRQTELKPAAECLLWTGERQSQGYGVVSLYVRNVRSRWLAHRVAYFLATGEDPGGLVVRHKCDTPLCCNPAHLELGTQQQNIQDARERSRIDTSGLQAHRDQRDARMRDRMDRGVAWCKQCQREMPADRFHRNRSTPHGLAYTCKQCHAKYKYPRRGDAA